jgi:hypothetical protein
MEEKRIEIRSFAQRSELPNIDIVEFLAIYEALEHAASMLKVRNARVVAGSVTRVLALGDDLLLFSETIADTFPRSSRKSERNWGCRCQSSPSEYSRIRMKR